MSTVYDSTSLLAPPVYAGGYRFQTAVGVPQLAVLEAEWPTAERALAGPMATFGWTMAAANAFAAEQTPSVLFACGDESARAVAPLARPRRWGLGRLEMLGLARLNEPADFIYSDQDALAALIKRVVRLNRPLLLGRLSANSPTIDLLRIACRGRALVVVRPQASCPFVPLDESWLEPESHLSSGRRSDFRRAQRRAEKRGEVRSEIYAPQPDEVDELLTTAFEIEARSWKGAAGTALASDALRGGHLRRFAHWASRAGTLRIALLTIGDQPAAMQIATEESGRLWLLKIGFDPAFGDCSPGILLLAETLRYAAARKLRSYEFLGTDEAWIRVWTEQRRECVSVRVYQFGLRVAAALASDMLARGWRKLRPAARIAISETLDTATEHGESLAVSPRGATSELNAAKPQAEVDVDQTVRIEPRHSGAFAGWMRRTAKQRIHKLANRAAKSYIAGNRPTDAMSLADHLAQLGIRSTIGYWDPVGADPRDVAAAYDEALDALVIGNRGDTYLSIKFPALGYSCNLLDPLVEKSRLLRIRLHFDALGPESVERTWEAIDRAIGNGGDIGCTLPARWRRSAADADWAAERELAVRVVKGQWPDPSERRANTRRGYLDVIGRLAGRARSVAVATHNLTIAHEALTRLTSAGTPATLELLYGLPLRRQISLAREMGVPVRIYIPYGEAYLPYCLSQLKQNPKMAWWLLRDAIAARLGRSEGL